MDHVFRYFDHHASTPCDPAVVEAMLPFFATNPANPHSGKNALGRQAGAAVEQARERVARSVDAEPHEIVFTSGATESNNLAIRGLAASSSNPRSIVVSAIEHKCVLAAAESLRLLGWEVRRAPVDRVGRVDLDAFRALLDDSVAIVAVQAANNEIGTIQDLSAVSQMAHAVGAHLHVDAAQAPGRMPASLSVFGADSMALSGHKVYGPKGVGALVISGGARRSNIVPQLLGGGQEAGLRSGTVNVPGVVGFSVAMELAATRRETDARRLAEMRDVVQAALVARIPDTHVNGDINHRLPNNLSVTFEGAEAEALLARLQGFALGVGSACNSGAPEPSYVLTAIGLSRPLAYQTIRIGFGRGNTSDDASLLVEALTTQVAAIRAASAGQGERVGA